MVTLFQGTGQPAQLLSSCQALPPGQDQAALQASGDGVLGSSRSTAQWRGTSAAGAAAPTVMAFVHVAAIGGAGLAATGGGLCVVCSLLSGQELHTHPAVTFWLSRAG